MYDSTERINKIYKDTSKYRNNTNEEDDYLQNCGKKGAKFHRASGKKTSNCTWIGNLYYFMNKF